MSVKLSAKSGDTLSKLQRALRLPERPPLLRLALAIGLRHAQALQPTPVDSRGPEIPLKVITAGDEAFVDSLLLTSMENLSGPIDPGERRRLCKTLVDFGLSILSEEYSRIGDNAEFLTNLARKYLVGGGLL